MQFLITTMIAVAGLAVAIFAYRSQSSTTFKRLHYTGKGASLLLARSDYTQELVTVRTAVRELIAPSVYVARIENTGKAPIRAEDFDGPLKINFGENTWFWGGSIETNRDDILSFENGDPIEGDQKSLEIKPTLLNPGDQVTFIALLDGMPMDPTITARIAGIEEVVFLPPASDYIQMTLLNTSAIYELRKDWPPDGLVTASLISVPIIMDVTKRFHETVDVLVNNKKVPDAHHVSLILPVSPGCSLSALAATDPLVLTWDTSEIRRFVAVLDGVPMDHPSQYVKSSLHRLTVSPPPMISGQAFVIHLFMRGSGSDIQVEKLPSYINDVKFGASDIDDYVNDNLDAMKPRVMLSNQVLWKFWSYLKESTWAKKLERFWESRKSAT